MRLMWILILIASLLSGCGFQFRHQAPLPEKLQTLYVQGQAGSALYRLLTAQLKVHGVNLLAQPDPDFPILVLGAVHINTKVASVDSRNQAAEYLQQYHIDYQLKLPHKPAIEQKLTFNRSFFNQTSLALGASRESELLQYEMERQAAMRIFWKLSQMDL